MFIRLTVSKNGNPILVKVDSITEVGVNSYGTYIKVARTSSYDNIYVRESIDEIEQLLIDTKTYSRPVGFTMN